MNSPVLLNSLADPGTTMLESDRLRPRSDASPQPAVRGVALDMDGLMFDTEPLYHRTVDELLRLRGHRYDDRLRRQMMGQPGPQAIQTLIDYFGFDESWQTLLAEADALFEPLIAQGVARLTGLDALLDKLDAGRIPYGVATSSRRVFAETILRGAGLRDRIQFLLTCEDVSRGKPAPEIYLRAAAHLGIDSRHMLVLEDSENGCAAAVAAGALAVAVPGPHSRQHDFRGAHFIAASLADARLRDLIDQFFETGPAADVPTA